MSSEVKFVTDEKQAQPVDNLKVLVRFIRSLPLLQAVFIPYLIVMLLSAIFPQIFLWVIGELSHCQSLEVCESTVPYFSDPVTLSINIALALAFVTLLSRVFAWATFEISGQWATRAIHAAMVKSVARVRTTYFDENPSGRLINRLVRDYDHIRLMAIVRIGDTINALAEVLGAATVVIFAHPVAALLILPVIAAVFYIQRQVALVLHHSITVRSIRFGAVLHRETDLIEGSRTFLLYGKLSALAGRLQKSLREYLQIHILRSQIEAWGRFWTSSITSLYSVTALVFIVLALSNGKISDVMAAVIITALLRLSPLFGWLSWVTAYLFESVATIRRVFELCDLPAETTEERKSKSDAKQIVPQTEKLHGSIKFKNYSMSYRANTPVILDNFSVEFPEGKRIGIVGRTGAGKTSIAQSLFRMVYVQSGDIEIGDRSIFDCDVNFARSHFGVVPQDPYLFAGSLRSNLDRQGKFDEKVLSSVLETVGLKYSLNFQIDEGGENLSVGERQLICLARAVITDVPYIIMDEPTSAVDTITDAKIQNLLVSAFKDRTVITIAHRLDTLSRYDWIIELKDGKLSRAGIPREFL